MNFLPTTTTRIIHRKNAHNVIFVVERLYRFRNPRTGSLVEAWRECHLDETFDGALQMQSRLAAL